MRKPSAAPNDDDPSGVLATGGQGGANEDEDCRLHPLRPNNNNLFWPSSPPAAPAAPSNSPSNSPLHELQFSPAIASLCPRSCLPFRLQIPLFPLLQSAAFPSTRLFDRTNARLGHFIAAHPLWHIFASLALIFLLSVHLLNINIEYDIRRSFSPENSKSMREEAIYQEFFNLSTSPQRAFILFTAKDEGTMLREAQIREVLQLDSELSSAMLQRDELSGLRACDPLCRLNRPFHTVAHSLLAPKNDSLSPKNELELGYPVSRFRGIPLFVGINFFGTRFVDDPPSVPSNHSAPLFVRTIILWYFNRADTPASRQRLRQSTLRLFEEAQKGGQLRHVNFKIFGDEIANREMIRGAIQATILMSIGLLLLLLFVTFVVYQKMGSLVSLPAVLCIVAVSVLCPLLSSLAAFGFSTWLGNRTYTIMCVTPFLIAGVGVDDAFIMLQSWQQPVHSSVPCLRQRLSLVLVHIGPSITITSLTNTIAFGIGFFTPTPQMSLFCLCTSIAVFIDFILTFSLLAPVLVLLSAHCPRHPSPAPSLQPHKFSSLSPPLLVPNPPLAPSPAPWVLRYAEFLHSARGRICAILVAIVLYAICISGVLRLKSTFEPSKAFPSDSPLAHSISSVREVFDEFFPITVIVNRPPNISDAGQLAKFNEMVGQLESLPESWGPSRTLLWLRSYLEFDRKNTEFWRKLGFGRLKEYRPSLDNLDFFMAQLGNPPNVKTTKGEDGRVELKAFQFSVVAKGMTEWWNRAVAEEKVRAVLERHPQFNATMHDADAPILNMLLTVKSDLISSIAVTIVCMALVCSLFISHPAGVGAIALCISSICFTMVGVISWAGADLDPVTMVDVLLATGFSVDYTAHVAHQFYNSKRGGRTSVQRIAQSLDEMCPPMLQAGISTVLCMLPLIFVPTYAIVAFAKTIFAVISIGLLHGLFFLPCLLCAFPEGKMQMEEKGRKRMRRNGKELEKREEMGEEINKLTGETK